MEKKSIFTHIKKEEAANKSNFQAIRYILIIFNLSLLIGCGYVSKEAILYERIEVIGNCLIKENLQQVMQYIVRQVPLTVEKCKPSLAVYYAHCIEETIVRDKILSTNPLFREEDGEEKTDIYYNYIFNVVVFVPCETQNVYLLRRYENYGRYEISKVLEDGWKYLNDCELLGEISIDYLGEISYGLPQLTKDDRIVIDELIEVIYEEFSARQEHFSYDIYLGDFMKGEKSILVQLAVVGEKEYFIGAELTKEENGYDIWMYPSPFGLPDKTVLDEKNSIVWEDSIDNILALDELLQNISR